MARFDGESDALDYPSAWDGWTHVAPDGNNSEMGSYMTTLDWGDIQLYARAWEDADGDGTYETPGGLSGVRLS